MPYSPTTRWRGTLNRAPITFTTAIPAVRSSAPYKKLWRFPPLSSALCCFLTSTIPPRFSVPHIYVTLSGEHDGAPSLQLS